MECTDVFRSRVLRECPTVLPFPGRSKPMSGLRSSAPFCSSVLLISKVLLFNIAFGVASSKLFHQSPLKSTQFLAIDRLKFLLPRWLNTPMRTSSLQSRPLGSNSGRRRQLTSTTSWVRPCRPHTCAQIFFPLKTPFVLPLAYRISRQKPHSSLMPCSLVACY